jgi:hypothetical protein
VKPAEQLCFKELRKLIELKLEQKMQGGPGQLRKAFKLFDKDASGFVTDTEFVHLMHTWGISISKGQAAEFIQTMDKDGNGTLDYNEFIQEMLSHTHGSTSMQRKHSVGHSTEGSGGSGRSGSRPSTAASRCDTASSRRSNRSSRSGAPASNHSVVEGAAWESVRRESWNVKEDAEAEQQREAWENGERDRFLVPAEFKRTGAKMVEVKMKQLGEKHPAFDGRKRWLKATAGILAMQAFRAPVAATYFRRQETAGADKEMQRKFHARVLGLGPAGPGASTQQSGRRATTALPAPRSDSRAGRSNRSPSNYSPSNRTASNRSPVAYGTRPAPVPAVGQRAPGDRSFRGAGPLGPRPPEAGGSPGASKQRFYQAVFAPSPSSSPVSRGARMVAAAHRGAGAERRGSKRNQAAPFASDAVDLRSQLQTAVGRPW